MQLRKDEVNIFFKELWRGKSVSRILLNLLLARQATIKGTAFDLGAGGLPSYWRFLQLVAAARVITLDMISNKRPNIVASLETPLPLAAAQAETVLLLNVLEHIFNHRQLLAEIRRLLKNGGQLYLWVPFLVAIHGDPFDYYRYSDVTLARLLREAGFANVQVVPAGGFFLAVSNLLEPLWRWRILRIIGCGLALFIEYLLPASYKSKAGRRWPVGYLVLAS